MTFGLQILSSTEKLNIYVWANKKPNSSWFNLNIEKGDYSLSIKIENVPLSAIEIQPQDLA